MPTPVASSLRAMHICKLGLGSLNSLCPSIARVLWQNKRTDCRYLIPHDWAFHLVQLQGWNPADPKQGLYPVEFLSHGPLVFLLIRALSVTGFVQTLESPGILLFRTPGLESPGKGIGPRKPWKFLESPTILTQHFWIFLFLIVFGSSC